MSVHPTTKRLRPLILFSLASIACATSPIHADSTDSLWAYSLSSAEQCQGAINSSVEDATDCFLGNSINSLFESYGFGHSG